MPQSSLKSMMNNPGIMVVFSFLALMLVNTLVIVLANMFFPENVVLGTMSLTANWAAFLSMAALSLLGAFAIPFFHLWEEVRGKLLSTKEWVIYYFLLNVAGVWLISRAAEQFGLGVSSWYVVVALAIAFDVVQGLVMTALEKKRLA